MLTQLIMHLDPHLEKFNTYEFVVLIAALARLRYSPERLWLTRFFTLCEPHLKECGTGNLTALIRAVSSLDLDPWVIRGADSFQSWWVIL